MHRELVVKEGWHNADLEPESQSKYATAKEMVKKMADFNRVKFVSATQTPG